MEDINMEDIRKKFFNLEEYVKEIQRENIGYYLKKLKSNGDDYKIKHVKKLYQIYNMFHQTLKVMICDEVFEYLKETSINDFYSFLFYIIKGIKNDIYKFISLIQDDNFDNDKILRKIDDNRIIFNYYLDYKNFCEGGAGGESPAVIIKIYNKI